MLKKYRALQYHQFPEILSKNSNVTTRATRKYKMIKTILKFAFAGGIIYWLLQSGKLDLTLISKSLQTPKILALCITLLIVQILMAAQRWRLLLMAQAKNKLAYLKVLTICWIGLFFNIFLPGAVTGDLIKLVYAKDLDKSFSKTFLISSALIDRVLGFAALITLTGVFSIINFQRMINLSPNTAALLTINLLLFVGVVVFMFSLFLPKLLQNKLLAIANMLPKIGSKVAKALKEVWSFGSKPKLIIYGFLISLFNQFLSILAIWTLTSPYYGKALTLGEVFTIIPAGIIATAIPIAPAGIGVGHAAFEKLFSLVEVSGGASFFNLFFVVMISINLFGVIPYIFSGKKHSIKEVEEFETSEA